MNDDWWALVMFMYLHGGLEDYWEKVAVREAFEKYAKNCPHLELDNDGRATHHICRHPTRNDPSDWVMCDRRACPFMIVNASPEEMKDYMHRLALESTNVCCRNEEETKKWRCLECNEFTLVESIAPNEKLKFCSNYGRKIGYD